MMMMMMMVIIIIIIIIVTMTTMAVEYGWKGFENHETKIKHNLDI